jgi:hypothetical protein
VEAGKRWCSRRRDDDDVPVTVDAADEEAEVDDLAWAYPWWCRSGLLSSLS